MKGQRVRERLQHSERKREGEGRERQKEGERDVGQNSMEEGEGAAMIPEQQDYE